MKVLSLLLNFMLLQTRMNPASLMDIPRRARMDINMVCSTHNCYHVTSEVLQVIWTYSNSYGHIFSEI